MKSIVNRLQRVHDEEMTSRLWPLFDLEVRTPRVTLTYPSDSHLTDLAELAADGIHPPEVMPFGVPWTDVASPQQERNSLQHHWLNRAQWSADHWNLAFATIVDGVVVGSQGALADRFPLLRQVETGSWLGRTHQGKGIGTEMRAAILHFLFEGLGAHRALSAAFADNPTSAAVSRKLGYADAGAEWVERRPGEVAVKQRFVLTREAWAPTRRDDIEIIGLDNCRALFGQD